MKYAVVACCLLAITGCKTADYVGGFVRNYCETMDEVQRSAIRATVAQATYPHVVKVECN